MEMMMQITAMKSRGLNAVRVSSICTLPLLFFKLDEKTMDTRATQSDDVKSNRVARVL
ncbi:hypothetical protein NTE_00165 [Candidatus Nitrososphaera evergladensis SR1]|uniref:Uncharacterized protein n=1 Tax=Candidatus Nitrososphaera evergladensis SR1 TaxID=1459636 RepID=A0A075MN74_9ARCH|nr:hypothetical protein NTE_00165 [Candidatus Nitrososphaera evergladensis SR1]